MEAVVRDNQLLIGCMFIAFVAGGIAFDMYLTLWKQTKSISFHVWVAQKKHRALVGAGTLATVFVCWLVNSEWPMVALAGYIGGHLFAHY